MGFFAADADVQAANFIWTGTGADGDWSDTGNWGGSTIASSGTLVFTGTTGLASVNDLAPGGLSGALLFTSTASGSLGNFTLSGSSMVLSGGGLIVQGGQQTINLGLVLDAQRNVEVANGALAVINGPVSGAFEFIKRGQGSLILSGSNSFSAFTLHSTMTQGTFFLGSDTALGAGLFTMNASAVEIEAFGGDRAIANAARLSSGINVAGANDLTFSGSFLADSSSNRRVTNQLSGDATLTMSGPVSLGHASNVTTTEFSGTSLTIISGNIHNTGTAASNLTITSGDVVLSGSNTHSGITTLTHASSILTIASDHALGTGLFQFSSGTLRAGGSDRTITNVVSMSGNSLYFSGSQSLTFSNTGTLSGWVHNDLSAGKALTFSGPVVIPAGSLRFDSAAAQTVIDGAISSAMDSMVYVDSGTLTLGGNSTYTGTTRIRNDAFGFNPTLIVTHASGAGTSQVRVENFGTLVVNVDEGTGGIANQVVLAAGGAKYLLERAQGTSMEGMQASSDLTGSSEDATARILGGTAGDARTLTMRFATQATFSATGSQPELVAADAAARSSDVLHLTGTEDDVFVLEMEIADVVGGQFLGWLNEEDTWVNAVIGNSTTGSSAVLNFAGSFALSGAAATSDYLGSWGYDVAANRVWAVLDHNSQFAVIPEPSVVGLIGAGLAVVLLRRRWCRAAGPLPG